MTTLKQPARKRTFRWVRNVFLVCGVLYILSCVACAIFQRQLIYYPPVVDTATADRTGLELNLQRWTGPSGKTIGWKRLASVHPTQGVALVMHGSGDNALMCSHYADEIQQAIPLDIYFLEFPGYADRPGKPSEATLCQSAEEALAALGTNAPVYLVGQSLGTGVATYLAGRHPEKIVGIVLFGAYNCLADVGRAHLPHLPVRWLLVDRFPSEDNLRNYHGPVAIMLANQDTLVPPKLTRRLYSGYAGPKRLWEFPERNHFNVVTQSAEVWKQIFQFWQSNQPSIALNSTL